MTIEQHRERVPRLDALLNELTLRCALALDVLLGLAHFQARHAAGIELALHERERPLQAIETLLTRSHSLIEERQRPIQIAGIADEQQRRALQILRAGLCFPRRGFALR